MVAGRYRALSLLRADRACAYLAAVQAGTNTKVEVQILLAMEDSIESVHLRFLADARKALLLQGPCIDRLIHVGVTEDGHPFVVREPQKGRTLAALLEEMGSLPTEAAVDVALAVCEALESAHAHGLVHSELEPNAVRLTWAHDRPSAVKVGGLGTSRALGMLSLDGRSLAALAIHAPERLASDIELDARADIWSVGVLLYTMLAGAPPFSAEAPATVNVSAALDEAALLAGVPDGLAELVDACLSRNPVLRPQSAAALASKLAVFGSHPVFEKRSSRLDLQRVSPVPRDPVETGPYQALVLERLVKEAAPGASEQSIDVEISVPDLALAALAASDKTPEPVVVTASVPPVAFSVTPPAAPRRDVPPRRGRTTALVAAACVAFGVVIGAVSMRASLLGAFGASGASGASGTSHTPAAAAAPVAVDAPPPTVELPGATTPRAAPAHAAAAPSPGLTSLAVSELPSLVSPRPRAAAPRAGSPVARTRAPEPPAAAPAAAAPAAAAPAAVDPLVHSASAPIQPQPKAADDDLRRFLDDRR